MSHVSSPRGILDFNIKVGARFAAFDHCCKLFSNWRSDFEVQLLYVVLCVFV
jgi:hypothetical protein